MNSLLHGIRVSAFHRDLDSILVPVAGNLSSHGGTSFEASISYLCWSKTPHHEDASRDLVQ
jgi:hypothetical protein